MSGIPFTGFVSAGAQVYLGGLLVKPKRGFFDNQSGSPIVIPQVTIEEEHMDEMEITEHPVEQGSNIADHAFNRPALLVIRAGWSNSPSGSSGVLNAAMGYAAAQIPPVQNLLNAYEEVNGALGVSNAVSSDQAGTSQGQLNQIYNQFLQLKSSLTLVKIYTARRTYDNMLIKSLALETNEKTADALFLRIGCQQIIPASTQAVNTAAVNPSDPSLSPPANNGIQFLDPSVSTYIG